jgi:hypothetical protein
MIVRTAADWRRAPGEIANEKEDREAEQGEERHLRSHIRLGPLACLSSLIAAGLIET